MLEYLGVITTIALVVLSPLYSDKLVRLYTYFGFFEPDVRGTAVIGRLYSDQNYPDEFDVDSWSEDYRILSVTYKNQGRSEIRNVIFRLQAPGGIIDNRISRVGAHGISLTPITDRVTIGDLEKSEKEIIPSSLSARVHRIEKSGEISMEFLVNTSQDESVFMVEGGVAEEDSDNTAEVDSTVYFSFNWEAQSVTMPAQGTIDIEDRGDLYSSYDYSSIIVNRESESFQEVPNISLYTYDDPEDNPAYEYLKELEEEMKDG